MKTKITYYKSLTFKEGIVWKSAKYLQGKNCNTRITITDLRMNSGIQGRQLSGVIASLNVKGYMKSDGFHVILNPDIKQKKTKGNQINKHQ